MNVIRVILEDISAKAEWLYGDPSDRSRLKALFTDGTAAMILYRLMQCSQRNRLVLLAMLFNKLNAVYGNCVIGRGASFGRRFVLIHSLGVVINAAVRGGDDIRVEHQVTIGAEKGDSPVLGDRVFLGAGAKIVGGVRLGNDVRVGANAVVVDDVPDGLTVVGIPAKPVKGS